MAKLVSDRPKMVHSSPFLTQHLVTPKDIATKRGEDLFSVQMIALPSCKNSRWLESPSLRYLEPHRKRHRKNYRRF